MNESAHQLRAAVQDLLLDFDQGFLPDDAEGARHAGRLRFALARVEEQSQAAVMESPLYTSARLEVATAILQSEIGRARAFVNATSPSLREQARVAGAVSVDEGATEQRAA